jgi:hypothetical protein
VDSEVVMMGILILTVVLNVANLGGLALLWLHIDRRGSDIRGLEGRVTRLEERNAAGLSSQEVRQIHERLADMDGRLEVIGERSERIDNFLMESNK